MASGERNAQEDAQLLLLRQQQIELARVIELQNKTPAQNRQNEEMLAFLELVTKATGEQLKAEAAAQALLSTMTSRTRLPRQSCAMGADSAEVTRLRAQFALDAKLAEIEASAASETTKQALRDAAQAAFDLATADMSGALAAAANEAARLSDEVRRAVDGMFDLAPKASLIWRSRACACASKTIPRAWQRKSRPSVQRAGLTRKPRRCARILPIRAKSHS
ncbi:hypothetical protein ACLGGT_21350 [Roseovarius sp. MS2]|uniref:hypothetical protein n=1 Tax=Roseovarius sp. MS2 TaxID=3390728 RepID=UPI003EDC7B51